MIARLIRHLHRLSGRLWVRVVALALLSVVAVLAARLLGKFIPDGVSEVIGAEAVHDLLTIIATSMLAVTTFSLGVVVTIYRAVSTQWTPRAHRMLMRDTPAQNVLATFVGAYIYALAALILLATPYFGEKEVIVLFGMTLVVIALIVVTILRWILHLQTWGSLVQTTTEIEVAALKAIRNVAKNPVLGANPLLDTTLAPQGARPILALETGYIETVFLEEISLQAARQNALVYIVAPVGRFVHDGDVLGEVAGGGDGLAAKLADCFVVESLRNIEKDPRFSLIILAEIASKALSSGINDAGTAIDIIGRLARILAEFKDERDSAREARYANVWYPPLSAEDLVLDAFGAIARDGVAQVEVAIALQKRLAGLARHGDRALAEAAKSFAQSEIIRAKAVLNHPADLERLIAVYERG